MPQKIKTGYIDSDGSTNGQVLTSNGSAVYWAVASAGVNTDAQYTWSNTQTFSNTIFINAISANGGLGSSGQVLTSNGSDTYWSTVTGGGGGGINTLSFNGFYSGFNSQTTGTLRRYFANNITLNKMTAWVGTTSGSNLKLALKKNGSELANVTIAAGANVANVSISANVLADSDYLTLDISSGSGTDIGVRIDYTPY